MLTVKTVERPMLKTQEKERERCSAVPPRSKGIHRALPGERGRGRMRNIYCTLAEGKKSMHVAAFIFVGLVVGNRGVPYSMLPFL